MAMPSRAWYVGAVCLGEEHERMAGCALLGLGIGNDPANVEPQRFGLPLPNQSNLFYDGGFPRGYLAKIIFKAVISRAAPKSFLSRAALTAVASLAPSRPPKKKPRQIRPAIFRST